MEDDGDRSRALVHREPVGKTIAARYDTLGLRGDLLELETIEVIAAQPYFGAFFAREYLQMERSRRSGAKERFECEAQRRVIARRMAEWSAAEDAEQCEEDEPRHDEPSDALHCPCSPEKILFLRNRNGVPLHSVGRSNVHASIPIKRHGSCLIRVT